MDLLKNMNDAMKYIEEKLTNEIDYKVIARVAHCSEYHFKRMFSFLAGITLSEYIRRRRLNLAAFELNKSDIRIIDVTIKYGYSSPDSFTRAFQNLHGVTPSEARNNGKQLKAYPLMTFQLSIRGGNEMNYRIEEKEAFNIVGIMKRVPIIFEGENPEITAMWKSLTMEKIDELKKLSNVELKGMIQASTNFSEERMEGEGGRTGSVYRSGNNTRTPWKFFKT
jgi:AraC family transcriptional regulator